MTHAPPLLALTLLLAKACDGNDDRPPPPPPPDCSWHVEMIGDSEENAHFYDEDGSEIQRVSIEASDRCESVAVELEHRSTSARLLAPVHDCVESSRGENTNVVSLVFAPTCDCEDPWDWTLTDKAPPVILQLQIKTVPKCDPG